jgi:3-dehydroquinate synthase
VEYEFIWDLCFDIWNFAMATVKVNLKQIIDNSYDIVIGTSLNEATKNMASLKLGSKYFVITDTNVAKLYGKMLVQTLSQYTSNSKLLSIPAGERSKNRKVKEQLENQLLSLKAGRDSVIIALGGGMIGDLAGFVAATLHRGVPYVQIPTTLLAQVDSSIGGKVAVDHPFGKNLIGAFYQPKKVYIDVSTLKTLSNAEFSNGMAEVIKYGAILDRKLFEYVEQHCKEILKRKTEVLVKIIKRCCELKRDVIQKDEKEIGLRRILNFGHTIGHAIEVLSHYKISHGKAVAIGMSAEARISASYGLIGKTSVIRLENLLKSFSLPTELPPNTNLKTLFQATMQDKKVRDGIVHYTLLEHIGKAKVGVPLSVSEAMKLFLK